MQKNHYSKKASKPHKHIVPNNPQYDRQYQNDDKTKKNIRNAYNKMLFDEKSDSRSRENIIKRMLDAYRQRKRKSKISKLQKRDDHWKGLECCDMNEDLNGFINKFRADYYSGRMLTFRQWCSKVEELLDTLDDK